MSRAGMKDFLLSGFRRTSTVGQDRRRDKIAGCLPPTLPVRGSDGGNGRRWGWCGLPLCWRAAGSRWMDAEELLSEIRLRDAQDKSLCGIQLDLLMHPCSPRLPWQIYFLPISSTSDATLSPPKLSQEMFEEVRQGAAKCGYGSALLFFLPSSLRV